MSPPSDSKNEIPLSQHPLIRTSDLDEAKGMARRLYGLTDVSVAPGRADFFWAVNRVSLGAIGIAAGWIPLGGRAAKQPSGDQYFFILARGGGIDAECGGAKISIAPGRTGMLASPQLPWQLHMSSGFGSLTLTVERSLLEEHFFKLTQTPLRQPLCFKPELDVSTGPGASLLRFIEFLVRELEQPEGLYASSLARASLSDALLTALLTCVQHDQSDQIVAPGTLVLPGYVRRAETYIEAHADSPISIADVAAEAGVSVRALQVAFRRYRGTSPKALLKASRLERARARLLSGAPETTVGTAASQAGYSHLSRFAADYKQRFGETPRDTLRRIGRDTQ